jgi:hypothetical protein
VSCGQSGQLLPCGQLSGALLEDRLEESTGTDDELLKRIELLERLTTLLPTEELLGVTLLQTAPVTVGFCAGLSATPLLPCTPNSMV